MDKTPDVRRAKASRFSSANKQITIHSGSDFKKLRREKVRRLSFVEKLCTNTLDCEMPSVQSDGEDEYCPSSSTSKRFKLPRKFFDDCQKVDHASVPRKRRSAIRKRSRESVSPQFTKVRKANHSANGIELVKKNGMEKAKLKQLKKTNGSPGLTSVVPISRDEEEVAETLSALAGMFSDSDKTETTNSTVPEADKDFQTAFTATAPEAAQESLNIVGLAGETVGIQFANRGTDLDLHRCKQLPAESRTYIPKSNCTKVPIFSKSSRANENPASNAAFPCHSELSWGIGLKRPMHNLDMANEIYKDIAAESVATFREKNELQIATSENKNIGSPLCPGLALTSVHGSKTLGSPVKLSAAKLPAWLGISTGSARPCSSENVPLAEKESTSLVDAKKMRKKCCTHVYISRLIKVLKETEAKDSLPLQLTHLSADAGSKQGTLSEDNKLHMIKIGSSGVVLTNGIACSGGEGSRSKLGNTTLLHKRLLKDQQTSTNSRAYTTQEQSFNLFSALAGSCGVEHESGGQVNGHRPEPSTQSHAPYMHPFTQSYTTMPISLPQSHPLSTSFIDSAAQKVQIQLPPYLGNSTSGSSMTVFQKQQQHQGLWAAQLVASYKPEEFAAAAASHMPNWQNSREESSRILQYGQPIHPAALDVLGPRYIPVSTLDQQLSSSTSLFSKTRAQRYNHHQLSTRPVVNGGALRADSGA